ncbi:UBP1-associated protein 2C-like [Musa acuminata AAA Group]|uniref:UBP1-associated protein 2C-like n=1 Tax=Musa acuminata AAA Group TaxID=214697 RepID=UPI0031E177A6
MPSPDPRKPFDRWSRSRIIESRSLDRLRHIVANAAVFRGEPGVVANVRAIADRDHSQRKLFIRGLGTETTTDSVLSLFSAYGEFEEAAIIVDRATGKSKGYGFITFRHNDGAHFSSMVVNVPADIRRIAFSPISPLTERSRRGR